jgi:P4 family phage/plasmid primase-like protien
MSRGSSAPARRSWVSSMSGTWVECSKRVPCPICQHDHWCSISSDGAVVLCHWAHEKGLPGGVFRTSSQGQPYTLFFARAKTSASGTEGPGVAAEYVGEAPCGYEAPELPVVKHACEAGEPDVTNAIYGDLFSRCELSSVHEADLRKRGFTPELIAYYGYKTKPTRDAFRQTIAVPLAKAHARSLFTAPGISLEDWTDDEGKRRRELRLDGPPSLMLPLRDRYGRICRVQLDVDRGPSKYLPLTAYRYKGSKFTSVTHVPRHEGAVTLAIRLVGGTYKADLATAWDGVLTISSPSEHSFLPCLEDVTYFEPAIVSLAPDADTREDGAVALGLAEGAVLYQSHGYSVAVETWLPEHGKGIDDVIAADRGGQITVLTGVQLWEHVRDVLKSAKAPPHPGVEARLVLAQVDEGATAASIFRPAVIAALARLDTSTVEYRTTHAKLVAALKKGETKAFEKALAVERDKLAAKATEKRLADLEARGMRVFTLGDHRELRDAVLDELCPVGGTRFDHGLLVYTRSKLFRYTAEKGIWDLLPDGAIINAVARYSGSPIGSLDGKRLQVTASMTKGVLDLVRAAREDRMFFDEPRAGIAFSNGFLALHIKTGATKLELHSRRNKARFAYPHEYAPNLRPKKYLAFLDRICRDMPEAERRDTIACLTQYLGACLFGIATKFEKVIILDGKGGTGNSTLLEIHSGVMPPGSVSAVLPHMMDDEFAVANLDGALLNIADDLPKRELLDAGRIKTIISGRQIEAGPKHVQNYRFRPNAGQLWACNSLPRTHDTTGGLRRRAVILKFTSPITEAEINRNLVAEILAEETAAIISLAVDALGVAITQNRLTVPAASDARVDEWLGDSQPLTRFVREELVVLEGAARRDEKNHKTWTAAMPVYERYAEWCEERGHKPQSETTFGKDLKEMLGITAEHWAKAPYKRSDASYYPVHFVDAEERAEREARRRADHEKTVEEIGKLEFASCPN